MCSYYEEMTPGWATPMSGIQILSPEDFVLIEDILDELDRLENCRTYDLYIASDTLTDSEETQS